jgi:DNA-binding CsgD family transcriptional regulator
MPSNELSALSSRLSGCDAIKLLEIIHRSLGCASENDFAALFPVIRELCPFDFAIALSGRQENSRFVATYGVDISLPEDFSRVYIEKDYLQADVLVKEFSATRRLQYWPDGWEKSGQCKEIISLCLDTNMHTGFIHGSRPTSLAKNGALFCFSGPAMTHDSRTAAFIETIVPHLHLSLSHVLSSNTARNKHLVLSERENEVLNWLKQGKSSWEMSVILAISERTVNYHVYNIMEKLEVANRPQAVAVAARLGLIDIE